MKYFRQEMGIFIWATIALIGGNFGQLVIPYYIGRFVDIISSKTFDEVYPLTL
jgi:ABC-type multidrug transport system fused ATPase/permease subunit